MMKNIVLTEEQLKMLMNERKHKYQSNEQEEENPFNIDDAESNSDEVQDDKGFGEQEITPEEQLELILQDLKVYFNTAEDEVLGGSREKFVGLGENETTDVAVKTFATGLVRVIDEILEERKNAQDEEPPADGDDIADNMDAPVEDNPGLNVQNEINESVELIKANFKRFM